MKRTKKIPLMIFVIVMLNVCFFLYTSGAKRNDFTYKQSKGVATITGYYGENKSVTIPETIGALPVVGIADGTFNDVWIHSVEIPGSITLIESNVFSSCTELTSITVDPENKNYVSVDGVLFDITKTRLIRFPARKWQAEYIVPESVIKIEDFAFFCSNLSKITLQKYITTIGNYAFSGCIHLKYLTLPEGLLRIENSAFSTCKDLENLIIPESVIEIGEKAFSRCDGLQNIHLSANIQNIGIGAFMSCSSLKSFIVDPKNINFTSIDGVLFDRTKKQLIRYPAAKHGDYIIPIDIIDIEEGAFENCKNLTNIKFQNYITNIKPYTFSGCTSLTTIELPCSIERLGSRAFADCTGLVNIIIPSSVVDISNDAFQNCTALVEIQVLSENVHFASENGVLFDHAKKQLMLYPAQRNSENYKIPEGVLYISEYAFAKCENVTNITIPNSVKRIGDYAFYCCKNLKIIEIPKSVLLIGERAFANCTSLTSVIFKGNRIIIGVDAFYGCTSLPPLAGYFDTFVLWGHVSSWNKTPLNWFLLIICFGWIWMAF